MYEKDFKQEVNATGRERMVGRDTEVIGGAERVVGQQHVEGDPSQLIAANLPVSSPHQLSQKGKKIAPLSETAHRVSCPALALLACSLKRKGKTKLGSQNVFFTQNAISLLQKGALSERPGGEGWVQGKKGPVCESTEFAVAGDRAVDKVRSS
jgi:hypothetical protein